MSAKAYSLRDLLTIYRTPKVRSTLGGECVIIGAMNLWAALSACAAVAVPFLFRWFLLKTDMLVGYGWKWRGTNYYPSFDVRNRSGSRTYVLGNVAYTRNGGKETIGVDNASIMGRELKPGTIVWLEAAPVPGVHSMQDCLTVEVRVRLQNGWEIKAQGPGQLYKGLRKFGFALRQRIVKASLPLAS